MTVPLQATALNIRHRRFVNNVLTGKSFRKSALLAGFRDTGYGSFLMKQPFILNALAEIMEKQGITDDRIAKKVKEGLNAYLVRRDGGKQSPDFHARHKYVETYLDITGKKAPQKIESEHREIVIIFTPEVLKGLKDSGAITEEDMQKENIIDAEVITEEGMEEPVETIEENKCNINL